MNTKALRQKILDLAIRGKLVPQNPNEEPASVLLERIRAEKERLIKAGKIKRPKKSATSDTPQPFDVPSSWEWCKLEEVISLKSGENINIRELSNTDPFPVYGGNGIAGKYNNFNVQSNTVVIGRVGFYCGSIHKTTSPSWVTDNALIVTNYGLYVNYLCFLLQWMDLRKTSNSTAQPVVSSKGILPLRFPLPPLAEQQRIVAEVEKWFGAIDEIEKGQTDLATLIEQTKSKVLDLAIHGKLVPQNPTDEPALNLLRRINPNFQPTDAAQYENLPQGWCECKLEDISRIIMGQSPDGSTYNSENGIEFHQGKTCFTERIIGLSNVYTTDARKTAPPNCNILCVRAPVGVVNITDREIAIGRGLCALVPLYKIGNIFLYFWLKSLTNSFVSKATGSTFKAISVEIVKTEKVPLPPLAEQQRIVAKIEKIFASLDTITQSLAD